MSDHDSNEPERFDDTEQDAPIDETDEETAEFARKSGDDRIGDDSQTGEEIEVAQMAERAKEVCLTIVRYFPLGIDPEVSVNWDEETIYLRINGDGSGLMIGKKGQTLDALQYLVNKITNRHALQKRRVEIDTEGYRQRRRGQLTGLARKAADEVRTNGNERVLEPMTPAERRIVHMALRDHPDVVTVSEGTHNDRRVVIMLRPEDWED